MENQARDEEVDLSNDGGGGGIGGGGGDPDDPDDPYPVGWAIFALVLFLTGILLAVVIFSGKKRVKGLAPNPYIRP